MELVHDKLILKRFGMFFKPGVPGQVKSTYADSGLVLYIRQVLMRDNTQVNFTILWPCRYF